MVLLHTCGGLRSHVSDDWPKFLSGQGYVVLTVDSFGSRGLGPCPNAIHPPGRGPFAAWTEMTNDAYGAFDHLATQPFVDAGRIAVIGYSLGANAINFELAHRRRSGDAGHFKAAIGFYGTCDGLLRGSNRMPLMEIIGERDVNHVGACRAAGKTGIADVHILPDAHHSFDSREVSGLYAGNDYMFDSESATEAARSLVRDFLARHLAKSK